ncbi:amine oxidase [Pilimelia terevasa]|uniref:Amine oxidase n=1 Tax=Pilimelia terevasa TaxID=53372 RepID=A0A8J3FEN5_9ACTN|nr:FAD-dependent oxidoreductase [Pilimelia terevasa]GGK16374.1 amine oxidase [Pilimelia terevasa]
MNRQTDRADARDVLVLGAGLSGLTVGALLGDGATVVEAADRAGGLVRTERVGDYWFDHVIHLLYFHTPEVERLVTDLLGADLAPCPPVSWVETAAGATRFPIQLHLGALKPAARAACLADIRAAHASRQSPQDYGQLLLHAFGRTLCELFFFPYNGKMWRRPLAELATSGFHWNLTRPPLADVVRGAEPTSRTPGYNSRGFYPRPPLTSPRGRGMEVLSRALAAKVPDLRLRHTVERVDVASQVAHVRAGRRRRQLHYRDACVSTLPLPRLVQMCDQAPRRLADQCRSLPYNRVRTVALAVRGRRPADFGHWRYYADPALPFTRLVLMTEFDPQLAPDDGWGMLAEVIERSDEPGAPADTLIADVWDGLNRIGLRTGGAELVDAQVFTVDPAYVVFTPAAQEVVERARAFLSDHGVTPLGRYGNWTYSSMAQVMGEAMEWVSAHRARAGTQPQG